MLCRGEYHTVLVLSRPVHRLKTGVDTVHCSFKVVEMSGLYIARHRYVLGYLESIRMPSMKQQQSHCGQLGFGNLRDSL